MKVIGATSYTIQIDDRDTFPSPLICRSNNHQISIQHAADASYVVARPRQ
jgi:hypothetical protein